MPRMSTAWDARGSIGHARLVTKHIIDCKKIKSPWAWWEEFLKTMARACEASFGLITNYGLIVWATPRHDVDGRDHVYLQVNKSTCWTNFNSVSFKRVLAYFRVPLERKSQKAVKQVLVLTKQQRTCLCVSENTHCDQTLLDNLPMVSCYKPFIPY